MTRAAERLGIKQPPLSQQIQALERELEVQLFRRTPKGVDLTDAGEAFFDEARKTLAHAERSVSAARRTARGEQGTLAIGFTVSASLNPIVSKIIRVFQERYPGVSLVLDEHGTSELGNLLRTEFLDVAFIRSRIGNGAGISEELIVQEPLLVAVPASHQHGKQNSNPVDLKAFKDQPFILSRRRVSGRGVFDAIYDAALRACRRAGFEANVVQETPQILTSLNLVAAGLGVTIVPASLRNVRIPGVRYVSLARGAQATAPIYLTFRRSALSVSATNFIHIARSQAEL